MKADLPTLPTLSELRAGDERAWSRFFEVFDDTIRAVAAWPRWHFDATAAEDAVQSIRVGIVQSISRLNSEAALPVFVKRICVRRCIDLLRKNMRDQSRLVPLGRWNDDGEWEEVDVADDPAWDPARALQRLERVGELRRALAQMDVACQAALRQFYVDGLSYKEMSDRQGVAVNTVGSRLSRCLEKLRGLLGAAE